MRIISGKYRGKHIIPDKQFEARPTTDAAKESLFNVLATRYDFEELEVLDLFAGTGSISYEFASRGALRIDAVESNFKHLSFIQKTARDLNFDQLHPVKTNVFLFLRNCMHKYDIIFADPPYEMEGVETLPDLIMGKDILKEEGVFILEHSKKMNFFNHPDIVDHRTYGSVNFSFFKR